MSTEYRATLSIPASHPALPGHFPDAPVVPAVVLLDCVLQTGERWLRRPVTAFSLPQVKFHTPLLPGQPAECVLHLDGERLHFRIARDGELIALGEFRCRVGDSGL